MEGLSNEHPRLVEQDGHAPQTDEPSPHKDVSERTENYATKTEGDEMVQKEQPSLPQAESENLSEESCDYEQPLRTAEAGSLTGDVDSRGAEGERASGGDGLESTGPSGSRPAADRDATETDRRRPERAADDPSPDRCFCHFRKSMERQAVLIAQSLKDTEANETPYPLTVERLQYQFERFVFNPRLSVPQEQREVRYNFYPPFMLPKAICNYHIFALTAPIPPSCKANRSGTETLRKCWRADTFQLLPKWKTGVEINDSLGSEVVPVGELNQDTKLVPLRADTCRLQWAKDRGSHLLFFSYPSLHMPPKLSKLLMETLLQPFANEITEPATEPSPCVTDEELSLIVDPDNSLSLQDKLCAMQERRLCITMAVRYCVELELMQRVFREPSMVRKVQEVLHHTFHHGYVRVVRETAKANLSNFATFHGVTYSSPLNNCVAASLMEGEDKADYMLDTIYLFLVLTWQTAMGMWHQAIENDTIEAYRKVLEKKRRAIYANGTISEMTDSIVDILLNGDMLGNEMRKALPNFITQSQVSAYRHFLLERANVPPFAAPFLPSDFVSLRFKESQPVHWGHVYLLKTAFYLLRHGGYLWEPNCETEEEQVPSPAVRNYCPCNLCSPHRMALDNMALHNELLAIGTFEVRNPEGKSFKLTPELWTNLYLDKFESIDFFPFVVCHYQDEPTAFTAELRACVTQSPEILSLIRRIQEAREEFLLTKGKGVYKDPQTGEVLSGDTGRERLQGPNLQGGSARPRPTLPPPPKHQSSRTAAPEKAPRALRPIHDGGNGTSPVAPSGRLSGEAAPSRHGPKYAQGEGNCDRGGRTSPLATPHPKRRHRRRVLRQPGLRVGDIGGGGRGVPDSTAPTEAEKAAPIILRKERGETGSSETTR